MMEDGALEEEFIRDRPSPPRHSNRLRIREDGILEEDFDSPEVSGFDSPGRRMPYSDLDAGDSMGMGVASPAEIAFQATRYAAAIRGREEGFQQENHYSGHKGKRKRWNGDHEDYGLQENQQRGSFKGKRWNFNGGGSQHSDWSSPSKRPGQKSSALGRIRSGVSVWNRIEEKQPSPSSTPPDHDFEHLGDLENQSQPETDALDLSYKSNALVAKVVVLSNPDPKQRVDGESPQVVVPKDRLKKKKVANNREEVVIPVVSSPVVSRAVKGPKKKDVPISSQVSCKSVSGSRKIPVGRSKEIGSSGSSGNGTSKLPNDASSRLINSSIKSPSAARTPKSVGKPANDGPKKVIGSSPKPSGSASTQPSAKKSKVTPEKKIVMKKAIKPLENSTSEDGEKDVKVNKSEPVNHGSSELMQAGLTAITTEFEDGAAQQSKDVNFVYWPMELAPSVEKRKCVTEEYTKDSTVHGMRMVMTKAVENIVTEPATKYVNSVQELMVLPNENITTENFMKGDGLVQALVVGTSLHEKNLMEQSGEGISLVQEPIVATHEESAISHKDVSFVQDNIVDCSVKQETMLQVDKNAQEPSSPGASSPRIVIDISSDSSPEVTRIETPCEAICSVKDVNAEDSSKNLDAINPSEPNAVRAMPSDNYLSSELVGNAQCLHQVAVSTGIKNSPCSLNDEDEMRRGKETNEQYRSSLPSVGDTIEILHTQMRDTSKLLLCIDTSTLVKNLNPPRSATDKEDDDLRSLSRCVSNAVPVLEGSSMDAADVESTSQLLLSSPSQMDTSFDVSLDLYAADPNLENLSNSQDGKGCGDNDDADDQNRKPTNKTDCLLVPRISEASEAQLNTNPDKTTQYLHPASERAQVLQINKPRDISSERKATQAKTMNTKFILSSGVPRVFTNHSNSAGSLKETVRPSHNKRNKTWHRTDTPSTLPLHGNLHTVGSIPKQPAKKQSPKKFGRVFNSSYVRKGNSLIRKPAQSVPPPIMPHGFDSSRKKTHLTERCADFGSTDNISDHKACSNLSLERPETPPLSLGSKLPSCSVDAEEDVPQPMAEDPIPEPGVQAQAKPSEGETVDLITGTADIPGVASSIKSEALTRKRMIYVKSKSNQLVAASTSASGDSSTHPTEKAEKSSTSSGADLYYMRKKNQLILNALTSSSQHKQDGIVPTDNSSLDNQGVLGVFSRECSRTGPLTKRLEKVLRKTRKHFKSSRVWTLGEQSSKEVVTSVNSWRVMPYLFPWKRTTYCKFSSNKSALNCNRGSLSIIGRKLQLMRKRDTIYTVSKDGFSLRKAGVVSIGGSSLKWSKSIDRHSKKASEEATLAVAEAERKRRERKRKRTIASSRKNGNIFRRKSTLGIELQQGERIYRVGSVRYKMDASKRTLIRITDEQSPGTKDQQTVKKTPTPRRLLIGNDEYIRIGNGNQLVRDPKKLIRMLASEKVRWSLHTVRLRLAKKQQYCQFFTRFGKCNKNSGKCPYIHDPEKVAICTKFLRGVCTDTNCKLTHKVIPERMPDCSYFLQGICTNINCPYRHVYVNPKAAICDGFLRGYCADGDECRKKHSYVCPLFEATGKCPQGSKCKLHHPKSRTKSKKRKHRRSQSSSKGRYFCSKIVVSAPLAISSTVECAVDADPFSQDGQFADFVRVDVDDDNDSVEPDVVKDSSPKESSDSDISDMQTDELDTLIKPIRIMKRAKPPDASMRC